MALLWILVVLSALAMVPLGVRGIYKKDGVSFSLLIGPFSVLIYPRKKSNPKEKRPQQDKRAKQKKKQNIEGDKSEKNGGKLTDFLPLIQTALDFLGDFRKKIRVQRLEMLLTLAAEDPADLAMNYGKAWTALGNLLPWIERLFVIGKRDLQVGCDFTANESMLYVRVDATITVGRLVGLLVRYGYRGYKQYKMMNNKNEAV